MTQDIFKMVYTAQHAFICVMLVSKMANNLVLKLLFEPPHLLVVEATMGKGKVSELERRLCHQSLRQ